MRILKKKVRALLIGCGNIGAQYDLNNSHVQTHAKCMFKSDWIDHVDVFDTNLKVVEKVAKKYNFSIIKNYHKNEISNYDIVSICTPTDTHFKFLKDCIQEKVKLVICEKPISYSMLELNEIKNLYKEGSTKILVNYYRRFQKKYSELKNELTVNKSELLKIDFRYYKGILNFASHGFDTVNYLLDSNIVLNDEMIISKNYDYFENDPTVSMSFVNNNIKFCLTGNDINDPIFEIDLFYKDYKVEIFNLGNKVNIFYKNKIKTYDSLILNYMIDVYASLKNIYFYQNINDNFMDSINLNKQLLKVI